MSGTVEGCEWDSGEGVSVTVGRVSRDGGECVSGSDCITSLW